MLDTGHPRDGGRFSVRVRVTYRRNRKYYPTGKALTPEEWDALPTTRSRALLDVRADIENSYCSCGGQSYCLYWQFLFGGT